MAVPTEARHHPFRETRVDEVRARLEGGADPAAGRTPPLLESARHPEIRALIEKALAARRSP